MIPLKNVAQTSYSTTMLIAAPLEAGVSPQAPLFMFQIGQPLLAQPRVRVHQPATKNTMHIPPLQNVALQSSDGITENAVMQQEDATKTQH